MGGSHRFRNESKEVLYLTTNSIFLVSNFSSKLTQRSSAERFLLCFSCAHFVPYCAFLQSDIINLSTCTVFREAAFFTTKIKIWLDWTPPTPVNAITKLHDDTSSNRKSPEIFIDRDGRNFHLILNFLRDGLALALPESRTVLHELLREAEVRNEPGRCKPW